MPCNIGCAAKDANNLRTNCFCMPGHESSLDSILATIPTTST